MPSIHPIVIKIVRESGDSCVLCECVRDSAGVGIGIKREQESELHGGWT